MKKLTTEEFITKARLVHKNKYDYSKAVYVSGGKQIKILCKTHGEFLQIASGHLSGKGCPICAIYRNSEGRRLTTKSFIEKSTVVHCGKYSYDLVDYKDSRTKVKITCKDHGVFEQIPSAHLTGKGCPICGSKNNGDRCRKSQDTFIKEAITKHGNKYCYNKVKYIGANLEVSIVCNKHGEFTQTPSNHLRGEGCPACSYELRASSSRMSQEEFIHRAIACHGERYDYKLVDYRGIYAKVKIICKEHGVFLQDPSNHIHNQGCPGCARYGFDRAKPGFVYVLKSADMVKIGITNREVIKRVAQINKECPQVFHPVYYKKMNGDVAKKVETCLLSWLKGVGLKQPIDKFDGYSECFYQKEVTLPQIVDKLLEFEKEVINGK